MKKLLTLFAFLVCALGANAVEIQDFTVDYTSVGKSTIGWKTDLIQDDWITADEDGLHLFNPKATEYFYEYQLWLFNGANLELDVDYTVKIVAKVSDGSADVRCRVGDWSGGISETVTVNSTDYQEYTFTGAAITSNNGLLVQFGDYVGTVSLKSITISHNGKEEKPVEWIEMLTNGNAETAWPSWATEGDPNETWKGDRTPEICAWAKTKGRNEGPSFYDSGMTGFNPFPADIEIDPDDPSNHVFVVHGAVADTEGDASSWDNMFWIEAPRQLKEGEEFMVSFRYKASVPVRSTDTQIHQKNPSNYLIWHAIGNIGFTTEWQTFNEKMTIAADMANGWSIAFNLNSVVKDAVDFYFDDLSIQEMKLDYGWYVAAANTATGVEYDYDAAIQFEVDPSDPETVVATVGKVGNQDSWVNEVMISTVYGNGKAFRANTINPAGTITGNDDSNWQDYVAKSNAKIALPAAGVWQITIAPEDAQILFVELEGDEPVAKDLVEIVTNQTEVTVFGQERQPTASEQPADPDAGIEEGTGAAWDNQFFIVANRVLEAGEETVVEFDYVANKNASTLTQTHGAPGAYVHWAAIGDVNFDTEWQHFEREFTIPAEAADRDAQSIAFCMAVIKEACNYTITNVRWYVKSDMEGMTYENLIDAEGSKNYFVKEGKGNIPFNYGTGENIDIVWTVIGSNVILGTYWDATNTNNDMIEVDNGVYLLEKNNIELEANSVYSYKVVGNRWSIDPGEDTESNGWQNVWTDQSGLYNLKFYFYPNDGNRLECIVELVKGEGDQGDLAEVYTIDYSAYGGFPFYVMGFVPEFDNGCMTDCGAQYGYKTDYEMEEFTGGTEVGTVTNAGGTVYHKILLDTPNWHQYFIANGIPTKIDGKYKVIAKVRASEFVTINVNMGWGWGSGEQLSGTVAIPQSDEFVEVEWVYDGIGGYSCNLVAQPGSFTGTIEWQWLKVYELTGEAPYVSNTLYFEEAPEFMKGQDNVLSVNLQNSQEIKACQFDLVLPRGVYINSIYNTWRSERHSVNYEALDNSTVRVVVVSTQGYSFYDYYGEILNMVFNVDGGLSEGDYTLGMKNIEMTTSDYETLRPEDQYITVHVKNLLMGDVDSNGQINVTDVVMIIDDILGKTQWNFNKDVADVNSDSYINVTDVVLVIDHVLGKVNLNRAAAADAEMGAISLSSDMKTVSLTNPSAYTAFQMDVTLPQGVGLEDVLLTERAARSHSVVIREMENGSYRIVGVSMKNDAFKGNVGDLLQLQLTGNAQGSVAIDNVLFVTPQGVQHELAGVNAFGDVTGISATLTNNGQMNNDNQYTLDGRKLNGKPMTKGIYVNGGRKVVIK